MQQVRTVVIDAGIADNMAAHERLLVRKIAYGTRNLRNAQAMTVEQAHAAIRAGMEIGDTLPGNVMMCAGVGVGSGESAALVLSRLADAPARDLLLASSNMSADQFALLMTIAQASQARHRDVTDPVEVVAAFGGFEIATMAGAMLIGASKRRLLMIDGLPALAALMLASRIAPPVTDYCVFCRSHQHQGLDHGLALFRASALLELGMNSTDGTGATLAWPLVANAAALVTDVPEGEEPGPTLPQAIDIIEDPLRR
jgi:nicotinate-nucleotide--dimethylbenzimidazole phosphoribosyltransferase